MWLALHLGDTDPYRKIIGRRFHYNLPAPKGKDHFYEHEEASLFAEKADELLKGEELMAEKPGKKGHRKIMKQVNLIDMIFDAKITSADNIVNLQCVLAAGNTHNLNPTLLVETIENCVALRHTQLHIVRKRLITKNNKNFR